MMRLYDNLDSGNGYKCRLALNQLEIPFERIEIDISKGDSRSPDFLRINPNGRIPVLEYEPGAYLAESNAILFYLADGSPLLPGDRIGRAQVLQWMCFEQYSHEPNIATSRNWLLHFAIDDQRRTALESKREAGQAALGVMEGHLSGKRYFVGESYTIADIALYAYTHVAEEGGFTLELYPNVREWLARVTAEPRHIPITHG